MQRNAQTQQLERYRDYARRACELINVREVPPLPEVALKVLEYADDAVISTEEISSVIIRDQGLTSQILKMANSAFFGLKRQIATIRHAAVVLGTKRLRSMVITASMSRVYSRSALGRIFWEHALVVALISSELAKIHRISDPEMAFVAGIMHDIGKSILAAQYPEDYRVVNDKIQTERISSCKAEQKQFGTDHSHVGAFVADTWYLPQPLHDAIQYHHATWRAEHEPGLTSIIYLADRIAHSIGVGPVKNPKLDFREIAREVEVEVDPDILAAVGDGIRARYEKERQAFGLPSA